MTNQQDLLHVNLAAVPVLGATAAEIAACTESRATFGIDTRRQPWLCLDGLHLYDKEDSLVRTVEDIQSLAIDEPQDLLVFFGLGLGFHGELLAAKNKGPLLIFEPNVDVIAAAMRSRVLKLPNTKIITKFSLLYDTVKNALLFSACRVTAGTMPRYKALFTKDYERFSQTVSQALTDLNIKKGSQCKYDEAIVLAAHSLPVISQLPPVEALRSKVNGIPGIFVGAGPSLDKNIQALKKAKNRSLIIATNSALKPLAQNHILPDMVLVIETNDLTAHLNVEGLHNTVLVVPGATHLAYLELPFRHALSIATTHNPAGDWMIRAHQRAAFASAGSVALVAFGVLQQLGCDPVVGVGMDLAYTEGKTHARGAVEGDVLVNIDDASQTYHAYQRGDKPHTQTQLMKEPQLDTAAANAVFPVTAWDGMGTVYSTSVFNSYRLWLENAADSWASKTRLYNCTEGGAHIAGFIHLPLSDVIQTHCETVYAVADWLNEITVNHKPMALERLQREIDGDFKVLSKMSLASNEALFLCTQAKKELKKFGRSAAKLQQIADLKKNIILACGHSVLLNRIVTNSLEESVSFQSNERNTELRKLKTHALFFKELKKNAEMHFTAFQPLLKTFAP